LVEILPKVSINLLSERVLALRQARSYKRLFLDSNQEAKFWFFREQFRFGHREVLLDFLQASQDNLILGFLQHGIAPLKRIGDWPFQRQFQSYKKRIPVFVWSKVAQEAALEEGFDHVHAIGSPWLYMLHKKGLFTDASVKTELLPIPKRDVLIVPGHGSGHYFATSKYPSLPKLVRRIIGDCEASVLLYYTEFNDPLIRTSWERLGFQIFCSGFAWGPDTRTIWTYNSGRPEFLSNTYETILLHQRVICLAPSTLAAYSISLGVPTSIELIPDSLNSLGLVSEGKGVRRFLQYESELGSASEALLGGEFGDLNITQSKITRVEIQLGFKDFKSSYELKKILPLKPGSVPIRNQFE